MPQKKVLIADDSPTIVKMLTFMLSTLPCEVIAATDGVEAIKLSYKCQPDLILLDILMPKMNGYQVCRLLKDDEETTHIPIVMLTAKDQQSDRFWGLATGADEYIVKDFEDSELLNTISRYLEQETFHPVSTGERKLRDITTIDVLSHANHLLDRQLYQSTITNRINKLASSIQHFDETILSVFELLSRILTYQIGAIFVQGTQATPHRLYLYIPHTASARMAEQIQQHAVNQFGSLLRQQHVDIHTLQGEVDEHSDQELLSLYGSLLVGQNKEIGSLFLGDSRKDKFSDDDREIIQFCSTEIAVVIDNARLYEANARLYANLERELQRAHDIQLSMLPQDNPMESSLRIEAGTIPAKDVGGDYYDYFSLNDHQLLLAIGDVTGKGVSAALMMATVKTALQMHLESMQNVSEIVTSLNKLVCEQAVRSRQYMTLFLGIVDTQLRTLTYCNAGHNFPYRISVGAGLEQLDKGGGLPLGFQREQPYTEHVQSVYADDILFFYTDGVVEAMNEHKELFGYPRLEELLLDYCREDLVAIHLKILERIEAFCHETPQDDDMTMLLVQCVSPSE
jgi:sigma-B regulation protein RsbU (phosphoserine phosphatase)